MVTGASFETLSKPIEAKECPMYEQLCTIYGDDFSEADYAQSSRFDGLDKYTAKHTSALLTSPTKGTTASEILPIPHVAQAERKRKRDQNQRRFCPRARLSQQQWKHCFV
ncbi:hypothetical protein Bca4012_066042 [Brassica carinata]|uniref:Uncharacterized protein n=1 Tax=Brassica carinata TaxID=52824 RepID=A0A8X7VQC7_BRACI|nr:hypothetical protein Bca52824_018364 [Brassica carinata]